MNLLLLLSAMLSALTGAASIARAPLAAHAELPAAVATIVRPGKVARLVQRPDQPLPSLAAQVGSANDGVIVRPALIPLYASRRRE